MFHKKYGHIKQKQTTLRACRRGLAPPACSSAGTSSGADRATASASGAWRGKPGQGAVRNVTMDGSAGTQNGQRIKTWGRPNVTAGRLPPVILVLPAHRRAQDYFTTVHA